MKNIPFNSNSSVLSIIKENNNGEVPVTGTALVLQPNSIDSFGNSIETATRSPISTSRDAKKGAVVNLTSNVEVPHDLTISAYRYLLEGAMCSTYEGLPTHVIKNAKITATGIEIPYASIDMTLNPTVIASGFKHDANNGEKTITGNSNGLFTVDGVEPEPEGNGQLVFEYPAITAAIIDADGKIEYAESEKLPIGSEVVTTGYTTGDNNGTFTIVDNTGGKITLDKALTAEPAPTGAERVEVSHTLAVKISVESEGYRYAAPYLFEGVIIYCSGYANANNNGIKVITGVTGSTVAVTSDGAMVEETPTKGVIYCVGYEFPAGTLTIDESGALIANDAQQGIFEKLNLSVGAAVWIGGLTDESKFDDVGANGIARIANVTGTRLTVDKRANPQSVYVPDVTADTKKIQLYIGEFIRTRPIGSEGYQEPSYTFELKTVNENNESFYEYSKGNQINSLEIGLSANALATMSLATVGTKTDPASVIPMSWEREEQRLQETFSTPSDVFRVRVQKLDEAGLMSIFTNATFAINNNIGSENVLGVLGAYRTSLGAFAVTLTGTAIFMNSEVSNAITNNCTVSVDFMLENLDGAIYVDIPNATISDGSRDFTANEKIKQNVTCTAYGEESSVFNYSLSSTIFYWLPTSKAEVC